MEDGDLRIGSYYFDGCIKQCEAEDISSWVYGGRLPIGIPLTEQWLLDFRFEKIGDLLYQKDSLIISKNENSKTWSFGYYKGWNYFADCDYVHELQNAWYVAEKTELTK